MEDLYKFVYNDYRVWEYLDYCPLTPVEPVNVKISEEEGVLVNDYPLTEEVKEVKRKPRETWIEKDFDIHGEDAYVENYANPLATITHRRFTICVTKKDDKIAIKLFTYNRIRNVGRKFFKVETMVNYISFNTKTNYLYTGFIKNYHKKRKFAKGVRKNEFYSDPINRVVNMINNQINTNSKKNVNLNFHKPEIIENVITTFFKNIPQSEKYNNFKPSERLYKLYCDGNGIKTPNNWNLFIGTFPTITMKVLRKNDMKLIDSFMDIKQLRGDKIRKILHTTDKIGTLELYNWCISFFGFDYMNGKSDEFLTEVIKNNQFYGRYDNRCNFSKAEKNNIFQILQLVLNSSINSSTFMDHITMYGQIKNFEEVKWKSKTYDQFKDEHLQYTERVAFYTKGEYSRKYDSEFKQKIQEPILDEYYPVLLETSNEYNLESFIQSNCVKGYVDRPSSIIISLRKGNNNSKERATIEFSVDRILGNVKLIRSQTLGRFNNSLTPEWENPVQILESRFRTLVEDGVFKLFTCVFKIGYNEYLSGVKYLDQWGDKGLERLIWEDKNFLKWSGFNEIPVAIEMNMDELIPEF